MSKPFYMKLYWGEYHGGTRHLRTAAEHGAYLLLIGALFSAGGKLRASDENLARHACCTAEEWAALKPILMPLFQVRRAWLTHKRVSEELDQVVHMQTARSRGGKASAAARAGKDRVIPATPVQHEPNTRPAILESESQSPPKPKKASGRGARRCPADYQPSPQIVAYALGQPDLDGLGMTPEGLRRELAGFRDYEFARPYSDWDATFRNWLRRAAKDRIHDRNRPDRADAKQSARHANLAAALRGAEIAAGRSLDDD